MTQSAFAAGGVKGSNYVRLRTAEVRLILTDLFSLRFQLCMNKASVRIALHLPFHMQLLQLLVQIRQVSMQMGISCESFSHANIPGSMKSMIIVHSYKLGKHAWDLQLCLMEFGREVC